MRKLVTGFFATIALLITTVTTVSAEEYEVQSGDNLWNIALENDTSIEEIVELNDLKSTIIHPKQILLLQETYKVKSGDTLIEIAKHYNVTVNDLKEWNDIDTDVLQVGQELQINASSQEQSEKKSSKVSTKSVEVNKTEKKAEGKAIAVTATAYTANCEGCSGVTYTGVDLNSNPDAKVIAVDPNVIPLGSKVYVEGYGQAVAADIGGAIKGKKIDVFIPNLNQAKEWGRKTVNVTILD